MSQTAVIKIDPRDPDLARLRDVARLARSGEIVGFPTETVYGIGAPMSLPGIFEKLCELKQRDLSKTITFHIGEWEMVDYLQVVRTPEFRYLTREFWPGPLTLIVRNRTGETIGLRYPRHLLATALINQTGEPFLATSANISGDPSPKTAADVLKAFQGKIPALIDGGTCEFSQDSTVLDISEPSEPRIIRRGANVEAVEIAVEKIQSGKFPRKKILIVCTGNSCRSPMAEGWLKEELRSQNLAQQIEVSSCGVGARAGMTATSEAVYVMKNREVDISAHRSKPCSREDVMNADLILAMGQQHYVFITGMVPQAKEKIRVLNVLDPIGMSMGVYEDVMNVIEKKCKDLWKEIIS